MGEVDSIETAVAAAFRSRFGRWPDGVWRAPGRVNLIGEHTDYNAGLALPFAIDREVTVAVGRRRDRHVHGWSEQARQPMVARVDELRPGPTDGWSAYPLGVLWAFGEAGCDLPGFDLVVDSTLPMGAGLASSAALEAAVAIAVDQLAVTGLGRRQLVEICHRAEGDFVGTPVGRLDQMAVLLARRDHGLLIDFDSLAVEEVPLTLGPLLVVDTHIGHRTSGGEYAARRRQCESAAAQLGVSSLRFATADDVEVRLTGELRRRARHVVTENERVAEVARRLRAGSDDAQVDLSEVLAASHASLRDDFEVSLPALDAVVEIADGAGGRGARLTGAGFGGCVIVVGVAVPVLRDALAARPLVPPPTVFEVTPAAGASRIS